MFIRYLFILLTLLAPLVACETMSQSRPIIPQKDFEVMIAGRYDADYVGTANCLRACHQHDKMKRDFEASTMGAQMSSATGMPVVDCESCHGPGSLAIEGITPELVEENKKQGKITECNYRTLIDLKELPSAARSLICLKCHSANSTFNLHNWNSGPHAMNAVACSDCHNIHSGPDLITHQKEVHQMCYKCHENVMAEFSLPSRHPVQERKVICTDCHNPHGTINPKLIREDSPKTLCTRCHAEKEGPFTFEHADVTETCTTCHHPHGSVNNNLLTARVPFLCLQCHKGHGTSTASADERKAAFYTRCTDCHSQIHGTDIPSHSGKGRFTQ